MSELKAGVIHTPHDEGMAFVTDSDTISVNERETEFYIKSEADKVIAKLEKKLDTTEKLLNKALDCISNGKNHMMSLARKNNHANYKRCLAMAKWCKLEQERIELIENQDITDDDFDKLAKGFYTKWHSRWLELAEKFTQNSTAQ